MTIQTGIQNHWSLRRAKNPRGRARTMRRTPTSSTYVRPILRSQVWPLTNIDIRMTKRNLRKFITTIEGIPEYLFNLEKIKKALSKMTHSQGAVSESKTNPGHKIIQIQGDNRDKIKEFLIYEGIGIGKTVTIHGLWGVEGRSRTGIKINQKSSFLV